LLLPNDKIIRTQYFDWGTLEWLYEPQDRISGHPSTAFATLDIGKIQKTHFHAGFEQFLYIVSGVGTQWLSGEAIAISQGMFIHNPGYIEHALANTGDIPLKVLTIYLPLPFPSINSESLRESVIYQEPKLDLHEDSNVQALQLLQDRVSLAMNMASITIDSEGIPVTQGSGYSKFCQLVQSIPEGKKRCAYSELEAGLKSAKQKTSLVFQCYLGVTNVATPIMDKEESVGCVVCGQVLLEDPADSDYTNITNEGFLIDQLRTEFEKLQVVSKSRIYTAAELISSLSNQFLELSKRYQSQLRIADELKAKAGIVELLKQTELQALQSQINPHFLFNTLNSIANLALLEEAPQTQEVVFTLSELMRYALRSANQMVSVSEEIDYIKNYLIIQRARFKDQIELIISIAPEIMEFPLPPLTLQPLVENSILHGLKGRNSGEIRINGILDGGWIIFEVHDDGIGIEKEKINKILRAADANFQAKSVNSIGISNVIRRMRHHFGSEFSFNIESSGNNGTKFYLKVPYKNYIS